MSTFAWTNNPTMLVHWSYKLPQSPVSINVLEKEIVL